MFVGKFDTERMVVVRVVFNELQLFAAEITVVPCTMRDTIVTKTRC